MADIFVLRDAVIRKIPIEADGDDIVLRFPRSEIRYPRSATTDYKSMKGSGDAYTIEALWFLLHNADTSYTSYMKECIGKNIQVVKLPDKKELLEWLQGVKNTAAGLDMTADAASERLRQLESSSSATTSASTSAAAAAASAAAAGTAGSTGVNLVNDAEMEDVSLRGKHDRVGDMELTVAKRSHMDSSYSRMAEPMQVVHEVDPVVEQDKQLLQKIREKERPSTTKYTLLNSHNKSFQSVLDLVTETNNKQAAATAAATARRHDRYNIVGQDFYKGRAEFGGAESLMAIDTTSSFMFNPTGSSATTARPQPSHTASTSSASASSAATAPTDTVKGGPIIIVPSGLSDIFNLYNISDFLKQGKLVNAIERKKAAGGVKPAVAINHVVEDRLLKFTVVDDIQRFNQHPEDWNRDWQLKGWKWDHVADIFAHVRGYYFHFDTDKPKPNVLQWNVKRMVLSKESRLTDSKASRELWSDLENFIVVRRRAFLKLFDSQQAHQQQQQQQQQQSQSQSQSQGR